MIIDIRNINDYEKGHLENAISIPYNKLYLNPKILNKDETYYLYCNSGKKSKELVNYLNKLGYHTINIEGGYFNNLFRKTK